MHSGNNWHEAALPHKHTVKFQGDQSDQAHYKKANIFAGIWGATMIALMILVTQTEGGYLGEQQLF